MGWGSFYKSKKPREFRYTYLTFDPKKKELERKIRLSKHRVDPEANPLTEEDLKDNLKGHFRRNSERLAKYGDPEDFSESIGKKNRQLVFVLAILFAFTYWIFESLGITTWADFARLFIFW